MSAIERTNQDKTTPRLLGAAFLLQAIASLVWTFMLFEPLLVVGDISASMTNIAENAVQMQASIVLAVITAIGVAILGCLLFVTLKNQNRNIALVAMGLYILEAAILAASRIPAYALLIVSQQSVAEGHPAYLQTLANLLYQSADYGDWLHMLPFAVGATMFYYLLFKSRYIPQALALFGLLAAGVALIFSPLLLLGIDFPLIVFLPNLPFELGIGLWLLVKGIRDGSEAA